MNGNGWPGSTASGVRTGKTLVLKNVSAAARSGALSSSHFSRWMPASASFGRRTFEKHSLCCATIGSS